MGPGSARRAAGATWERDIMTQREKIGLGVLVALFVLLASLLVWVLRGTGRPGHDPSESVFVKQRIINLNK